MSESRARPREAAGGKLQTPTDRMIDCGVPTEFVPLFPPFPRIPPPLILAFRTASFTLRAPRRTTRVPADSHAHCRRLLCSPGHVTQVRGYLPLPFFSFFLSDISLHPPSMPPVVAFGFRTRATPIPPFHLAVARRPRRLLVCENPGY